VSSSESAYGNVSIGATAALIKGQRGRRESIWIKNNHASQILYLGSDSSVTTSNGYSLAAGQSIELKTKGNVYGIASGAGTDVRYFEAY
jgi:beta-N-acetylglucosaminidase